jgi:hypothetical protein
LVVALTIQFEQKATLLSQNIFPMPLLEQFMNIDFPEFSISNQENLAPTRRTLHLVIYSTTSNPPHKK